MEAAIATQNFNEYFQALGANPCIFGAKSFTTTNTTTINMKKQLKTILKQNEIFEKNTIQ